MLYHCNEHPHQRKLLINGQRHRCINVNWWKLEAGTSCLVYDAYPNTGCEGQQFVVNNDRSVSPHHAAHLVLGLAAQTGWDVIQLVQKGASNTIYLRG